jgi:hypothetical protein
MATMRSWSFGFLLALLLLGGLRGWSRNTYQSLTIGDRVYRNVRVVTTNAVAIEVVIEQFNREIHTLNPLARGFALGEVTADVRPLPGSQTSLPGLSYVRRARGTLTPALSRPTGEGEPFAVLGRCGRLEFAFGFGGKGPRDWDDTRGGRAHQRGGMQSPLPGGEG